MAPMSAPQSFSLETAIGATLHGYLNLPAGRGAPTIVAVHGFKGFMEWGFFPYWADLLSDRGFAVVRFNLSGAGMQPGDEIVTDREAFRRATIGQDLGEVLTVLDALAKGDLAAGIADPERISLFGHSRGGGVALLAAAHAAWRHRVRSLVTWAAVATFSRLEPEQVAKWRERGEFEILNVRTGQRLMLGTEILDDLAANAAERDLAFAAGERRAPWLIVHGDRDETVGRSEAETLASAAADPHELLLVPGGDHGLGGRHPFRGPQPALIQALNATQKWFRRHGC
jgi:uncharacterized protein